MAISETDLAASLNHCRGLLGLAEQLDGFLAEREVEASQALLGWNGDYSEVFRLRLDDEADEVQRLADVLRAEADGWAQAWTDTVNGINQQRRQDRVQQVSDERGFGEKFIDAVDVFHGDDSGGQVRPYSPVSVPTPSARYAPTGVLETF